MNAEKSKLRDTVGQMNNVIEDLLRKETEKVETEKKLKKASDEEKKTLLGGKDEKEFYDAYFSNQKSGFDRLESLNEEIENYLRAGGKDEKEIVVPTTQPTKKKDFKQILSKKEREQLLKDINIEEYLLEKFIKKPIKEVKTVKEEKFTIYKSTSYSKISNSFCEGLSLYFIKRYPNFFKKLYTSLKVSGMKYLSKTYVSIIFFTSFLVAFLTLVMSVALHYVMGVDIIMALIRSVAISFISFVIAFAAVYFYPSSVSGSKRKKIKNDLPFVIIHMAAVAGSGAQPIAMFNLVLSSGEYKGLEGEIKKIINYVNLYGYDLSTAMKAVSLTTPSPEFKELLTGITATIESGGDLKAYLKGKAEDAVNSYKMERKKYVESLSTYSDMYTGIAIAAPLLFMVTLAIINILGGKIGPFSVKMLSNVGVYAGIPLMNILFFVFLGVIQPE